jgi:glycosyltransferase involved in cell wall biosynthesis
MRPAVILLTFNSEATLGATLERARMISDEVFVVDSYSTDATLTVAASLGARIVQHPFEHYGAQRNWAIDNLPITRAWQLHLDADELMDGKLVEAILDLSEDTAHSGFFLPRFVRFLGRVMRHGGMSPTWHMRLFRTGAGRCEDRKYDQHFVLVRGTSGRLPGILIDDIRMPLSEWTARHNRWSDGEVSELIAKQSQVGRVRPRLFGAPTERNRYLRSVYYRAPLFVRPFALFAYRYVLRLGILDGLPGFIFWVLQTFWFRFLVDAKMWERRNIATAAGMAARDSLQKDHRRVPE